MHYIDRESLLNTTAIMISTRRTLPVLLVLNELEKYPNSFSLMLSALGEDKIVKAVKLEIEKQGEHNV